MEPSTDTAVLDKLLEPLAQAFSPEAVKQVADFRADARTQALIDTLAEKANEGTLSEDERKQYESFVRAGNLIAVLQAKARRILAQQTGT